MDEHVNPRRGGGDGTSEVAAKGGVVAGMTALSRVSGLLRDMALGSALGASGFADVFFLALRIPNFFRRLFGEGALAAAFVPVLADVTASRSPRDSASPNLPRDVAEAAEPLGSANATASRSPGDSAMRNLPRDIAEASEAERRFVAAMAGNLVVVLVALSVIGVAGAWGFAALFMPGLLPSPEKFALAVDLTRIMFPYLALICLTAFAGAVLNHADRFAAPAFAPVLLNVALILAAWWAVATAPGDYAAVAYALAWGVLAAGVAQLLSQLPSLARARLLVLPKPDWKHPGVRRVGALFGPAALATSAGQVNALLGSVLASMLATGSASWLYYADRLLELPIGLVAIALGTVLLPNLSRLHADGAAKQFRATLDWGLRTGVLLGVPAAAALALLAEPLVATLFLRNSFLSSDVAPTALALRMFAIGLVPLVLVKIAAQAYFARQDTRTPLRYAVAAVAVNVAGSLATFWWLGHAGLALATSVAAVVNAALLMRGLAAGGHYKPGAPLLRATAVSGAATAAMCAALWYATPGAEFWLQASELRRVGTLGAVVLLGLGVYAAAAVAGGIRPRHLLHRA